MKAIVILLALSVSIPTLANGNAPIGNGTLHLGAFDESRMKEPQCGCWYYYPLSKKLSGRLIAIGESAKNAITLMIDGKPVTVGNWDAKYTERLHKISYKNEKYEVTIQSTVKSESKYSSEYDSVLTVKAGSEQSTIEAYGSCGC